MAKLFYIALEFAPVQTTGSFRSVSFVDHLTQMGHDITVASIDIEQGERIFGRKANPDYAPDLLANLTTLRLNDADGAAKTGKWNSFLRVYGDFTDTFYRRFRASLHEQIASLPNRHFDAVVVSLPPFGAGELGIEAASALNAPLIVDMRDGWAEWEVAPRPTYLHYKALVRQERRVFERADAVIATTEHMANLFRSSHPHLKAEKFHFIPNGFDGDSIEADETISVVPGQTVSLAHVGSYYYNPTRPRTWGKPHSLVQHTTGQEDWFYRTPNFLLQGWRKLADAYPDVAARLKFHQIGTSPPWLKPMFADFELQVALVEHGQMPKQDVMPLLETMDWTFSISLKRKGSGDYFLASKTFDYIAARKPILSVCPAGSQKEFVQNTGLAIHADPDDPDAVAEALRSMVQESHTFTLNSTFINGYRRIESAHRLDALIGKITG
ncbi:MAG: glycosyltransferase [Pseudomonadota bacterium]